MKRGIVSQKRRESHVNLPCKITRSKCQTIPVEPWVRPRPRATDGKEVVRLVTHDMVREMIIPHNKPNIYPGMVDASEFERLKQQSKVLTLEDKKRMMDAEEAVKQQKLKECVARKEQIQSWEKKREKGVKLTDLEQDARDRANHLLRRAFELQQENEEEVKMANQIIMGAKCHVIREAQIAEKKLVDKELEQEERRLDQMMEDHRRAALKAEEDKQEARRLRNKTYVKQILDQARENEIQRLLGAEQIEEEAKRMNEALMEMQMEELRAVKAKALAQEKTRAELKQVNTQLKYFRDLERAESQLNDQRILEYQRDKARREEEREAELEMIRVAKEREIARLRALQERAQDAQGERDAINAQRIADDVERQWRRNEREAERKKAEQNEMLKQARALQTQDRERMQALEIAREKRQFENILEVQREQLREEKRKEQEHMKKTDIHRSNILRQINEKEYDKIKQRQETFEEGLAIKLVEENRRKKMEVVMKKKIADLHNYKLPPDYVTELEMKLKAVKVGEKLG